MGALITIHGKLLPDEAAKTPLLSAVSNFSARNAVYTTRTVFHVIIDEKPRPRLQQSLIAKTQGKKADT